MKTLATRTAELHVRTGRRDRRSRHSRPSRSGRRICQPGNSRLSPSSTRRSSCSPPGRRHCRENIRSDADALLGERDLLLQRIETLRGAGASGLKTRHHGDYHLGQVLLEAQ